MVGFMGKCPECKSFGSFEELGRGPEVSKPVKRELGEPERLKHIKSSNSKRVKTSLEEFDRVMGGGIVKDSITILTAKPGEIGRAHV